MTVPRLLIVDDEPDIRQLLKIYFERQGYQVVLGSDGLAAVELAQKYRPHLLLLDIQMPHMNGMDVVRTLRSEPHFTATPMVAITAYARVHVAADIIRAGFDEAVYKPIDFGTLHEIVLRQLRKS